MEKGFYHNENNEIVFCGNKRMIDPDGLMWQNLPEDQWPNKLRHMGVFTNIWDGESIVENPSYTEAKQNDEDSTTEINNKLQQIAGMSHDQIDTYLDNNSVENTAIRMLFHVQLALLHKLKI